MIALAVLCGAWFLTASGVVLYLVNLAVAIASRVWS